MTNNNALTGIVMLETMWATRGKDLLDLISPFIRYTIAKLTTPGEEIDLARVHAQVSSEFGYLDMPKSIVVKVLNRDPTLFKRESGKYVFVKPIDADVQKFEKRRDECEQKIDAVGTDLASYLETHVHKKRQFSADMAISYLQAFFSRHGLYVGTNRLEEENISPRDQELDYYIAQYIFEKKAQGLAEFGYIIDLVKGYYLQSAIYIQAENGNIVSANYSNVTFYYDTPFLLRLMGWRTKEDMDSATELHTALIKRKGSFAYFPQTQREINSILNAYQHSIGHPSVVTLELLDEHGYTSADVDRLKQTWEANLSSRFTIQAVGLPAYKKTSDGSIDQITIIDEVGLRDYLLQNIKWHSVDALDADIASSLAIHRLRGGIISPDLETCGSVFVTTNNALAKQFNKYYRENVEKNTFPLLISDTDLSAITWIKSGGRSNLPEKQLLRNAYMAMQPTPEMLEKFGQVLSKMEGEGKVTPEVIAVLKANRYVKKEILFASFDGGEGITENVITSAMNKITEDLTHEMRQDMNRQVEEAKHNRIIHADDMARKEAKASRDCLLKWLRWIALCVELAIVIGAIVGTIRSWGNIAFTIPFMCFAVLSVFSMIDTGRGREKFIDKQLVRMANHWQTYLFEKKKKQYRAIAEYGDQERTNGTD